MNKSKRTPQSRLEQVALQQSNRKFIYEPTEKIPVLEVDNYPALGKLVALRFIEWVQENPEGIVSLPVGKTPEHFIKNVIYLLENWQVQEIQNELETYQIDPGKKPKMNQLRFVQAEEFYPINPTQNNSFRYFISKYYNRGFGIDPKKTLLMNAWTTGMPNGLTPADVFPDDIVDLSLRTRYGRTRLERLQKEIIERVDQYCTNYEDKIREMEGIGFYISGIGPDGHISFNVRGSDHYSTTRLTGTNYETQATAATDLGGIEVARNRLVMTIGLSTITYNRNCVGLVMAAGEDHAGVIKDSIENAPSNLYPATALQKLKNSRFYLTRGAASLLVERRFEDVTRMDPVPDNEIDRIVIDLGLDFNKKLVDLEKSDFETVRSSKWILKTTKKSALDLSLEVRDRIETKINKGIAPLENHVFMHTAPHHDDIMLGYWAYIIHLVRSPKNVHHFNYMTSGFNAVTNAYAKRLLVNLQKFIKNPHFVDMMSEGYFDPDNEIGRNRDIYQYLDGVAAHSRTTKQEGEARRLLRNLMKIFDEDNLSQLTNRISEMILYFDSQYPGKKDLPYIQQLKGMIREWEADLLWGYLGFNSSNVHHLRLGFYGGGMFGSTIDRVRDVEPVLNLARTIQPTVVTVAYDPEGSGPSTHYKVLQTLAQALHIYQEETGRKDIQVWGYRNVWFRFHPSESDVMVPVSLNSMAVLENAFDNCFGSQREASFPSHELDGPFSRLSQRIMVEQYHQVKTSLGREYFNESTHPRLRATHGMVYLKTLSVDEFYEKAYELRKSTENVKSDQNANIIPPKV
ncbi:glucosamine-6-phosphate deaminase [candidate division KSB1 bacterium]|jgi:glucosamine-6-phosphate deaminase|nr:glucosamine-6-phosphate deaminase [candidate division KSB1 bacterium]